MSVARMATMRNIADTTANVVGIDRRNAEEHALQVATQGDTADHTKEQSDDRPGNSLPNHQQRAVRTGEHRAPAGPRALASVASPHTR